MAEQTALLDRSIAPAGSKKTTLNILILDDDTSCRVLLKSHLRKTLKERFELTMAESGSLEETLAALSKQPFDLVLIDLNLPDSSGLNTLDVLHKQFPQIAKMVITGETDEAVGLQAMSRGAQEYLVKGEYTSQSLTKSILYAIERKRMQEEQYKNYTELKKANQELKTAQSQIIQSEKLASIGQLAAGVAHEMNTPVGFVACNFETLSKYMNKIKDLLKQYENLAKELDTAKDAKYQETVNKIRQRRDEMKFDFVMEDLDSLFTESQEGLTRVTSIISNLRDFSRIDQVGNYSEYDINQGIKTTLTVCQNEIKYSCDVKTDMGNIPKICCNPGQINQVFLNILINAAQAIESQKRKERGNITIKTWADDTWVYCQIEDDGPGIPQEIIKKIFDPFFTTKPAGKGTGLGLNVSYNIIVNKHKGQLNVSSVPGKGTAFLVQLQRQFTPPEVDDEPETETYFMDNGNATDISEDIV